MDLVSRPCCSAYHDEDGAANCYHCNCSGAGVGFCFCSDADIAAKAADDAAYMAYQLRCFCGACWEGLEVIPDKPAPCALNEYNNSQDRLAIEQEQAARLGLPIW